MVEIIQRLTLDFKVSYGEITQERLDHYYRHYQNHSEIMQSATFWESIARQNRLLAILVKDKETLNKFLTYLIIDEFESGINTPLKKFIGGKSLEEILEPVILKLGGEDRETLQRVIEQGIFYEHAEHFMFSFTVEWLNGNLTEIQIVKAVSFEEPANT